jgi:SHS family lactate transporter-like MFS transporter
VGPNGWRALFFIGGLPALLSIFIRAKVKEPEAWHEHRTDWTTYRRSIFQYWPRFLYLVLFMTMLSFMSHGTQDMYPTLLRSIGFSPRRIADMTVLSGIGAVLGGLFFGHYSDRGGRRRAMMIATICCLLVVPFWVNAHNMVMIIVGVFLMQFFVQGAWGVVPAHINELSPGQYRGFFPGFAYQLGILCAASIPYVESVLGERFTYTQAMGGMMTVVFVLAITVMYFGPEARGVLSENLSEQCPSSEVEHRLPLVPEELGVAVAVPRSWVQHHLKRLSGPLELPRELERVLEVDVVVAGVVDEEQVPVEVRRVEAR